MKKKNYSIKSKIVSVVIVMFLLSVAVRGQEKRIWNGKKCAVCLTYDDGLNIDLDNVIPALDSAGFNGTFFLPGYSETINKRLSDWRKAAAEGHEIGNHTLFHPCIGNIKGREWVNPEQDLSKYTLQRMVDEIKMANKLLKAIDGKSERTLAYPCGDTKAGDSLYINDLKSDIVAARGVVNGIQKIDQIDLYNIGAFMANGQSGADLIDSVKKAMKENALIVFLFHGVGGEHNINISPEAHQELIHFLKQNEDEIWVAPFIKVAQYVKEYRKEN